MAAGAALIANLFSADQLREIELRAVARSLDRLYAAQKRGDDTVRTRQRVAALEAIQKAFQGYPEAMAE